MPSVVRAIESEYRRYKTLAEGAIAQLDDSALTSLDRGNSIAVLVWHLSGNLASRFTDFLTSDGEKPWRKRESEFERRDVSREELLEKWDAGWAILFDTLDSLDDDALGKTITIRGRPLSVLAG